MTQNSNVSQSSHKRVWQVVFGCAALLLTLCLIISLIANVGLGGWALWTRWELQREQEHAADLESQVQRLSQLLQESGVEIPLDPADSQLMDTTGEQVAGLRGLLPTEPVERALMTQDQLHERMRQDFEEEFPPNEARDYALTLAAFDFVDPDLDMYNLLLQLYTEQVAGFYDPETEQIYVIADLGSMGQMERLIYAHEFTHALQDQYFDLEGLGIGDDDAEEKYDAEYLSAVQALVEGDARLMEQQFLQSYYLQDELAELLQESLEVDTTVLDTVPDVLSQSLFFPYEYGQQFVEALYAEGGWSVVDAAYANPPVSTEHILHPDRYLAGDMPQLVSLPPLTDTLGTGWRQADEDVMGEYFTYLYLAQQIPQEDAKAATKGWGGDRYMIHHRQSDGSLVMALRTVWDTSADAKEFVDGYVAYAEGRFGHSVDMTNGARLCWAGDTDHLCLVWNSASTTVVRGPDETTVELVLEAVSAE
ncbi:MAG: hypothetical protein GY832_39640 [Chloroflexi bacterium]|nr:hypothetical protein [Chloroflexota bacterium]